MLNSYLHCRMEWIPEFQHTALKFIKELTNVVKHREKYDKTNFFLISRNSKNTKFIVLQ